MSSRSLSEKSNPTQALTTSTRATRSSSSLRGESVGRFGIYSCIITMLALHCSQFCRPRSADDCSMSPTQKRSAAKKARGRADSAPRSPPSINALDSFVAPTLPTVFSPNITTVCSPHALAIGRTPLRSAKKLVSTPRSIKKSADSQDAIEHIEDFHPPSGANDLLAFMQNMQRTWNQRMICATALCQLLISGKLPLQQCVQILDMLPPIFEKQVADLRSIIVKEIFRVSYVLCEHFGDHAAVMVTHWLPTIFKFTYITVKVMSDSAAEASQRCCLSQSASVVLPLLAAASKDSHAPLKARVGSCMVALLSRDSTHPGCVDISFAPSIADVCVNLVEDASSEVRPQGRLALAAYLSRWPDHAAQVIARLSPAGQRSFAREAPSSLAIENAVTPAVTKISARPSLQALRRQVLGQRNLNGESADA
jgi:hypothetical protein